MPLRRLLLSAAVAITLLSSPALSQDGWRGFVGDSGYVAQVYGLDGVGALSIHCDPVTKAVSVQFGDGALPQGREVQVDFMFDDHTFIQLDFESVRIPFSEGTLATYEYRTKRSARDWPALEGLLYSFQRGRSVQVSIPDQGVQQSFTLVGSSEAIKGVLERC